MNFEKNDLKQVNEEYINSLNLSGDLASFTSRAIQDLKELWERIDQNPENSSRPSGSMPPWTRNENDKNVVEKDLLGLEGDDLEEDDIPIIPSDTELDDNPVLPKETEAGDKPSSKDSPEEGGSGKKKKPKKNPGRQPGAKGHSRTVVLPVDRTVEHRPEYCKGCAKLFDDESPSQAIGGHYQLDIPNETDTQSLGIQVIHTKHIHYQCACQHCGFITRYTHHSEESDENWNVRVSEMHLVGHRLVALIIYLSFSMRLSRKKVQQFLSDWLKVDISTATINQCIHEAARILEPLEEELINEVREAHQNYVDETPWWERGRKSLYMWVFASLYTCYFVVGGRTKALLTSVLPLDYTGQLMSDGYQAYREYENRGRCWPHLIRKAQGLAESLDEDAEAFGKKTLKIFERLMDAVYSAREGPPLKEGLKEVFKEDLLHLQYECVKHNDHCHEKTGSFARELLYDWDAIFAVLDNPHLPLSNNEAERALRHWVIYRRICFGTQSKQGSRAVSILASVIETCKRRNVAYWDFVSEAIQSRRMAGITPPLPSIPVFDCAKAA